MTPGKRLRDPSFNPNCIACETDRLHTPDEKAEFHPLSGHGYIDGRFSHPDLEAQSKTLTVSASH